MKLPACIRMLACAALVAAVLVAKGRPLAAQAEASRTRAVAVLEHRAGSGELRNLHVRIAELLREKTSLAIIDQDDAKQRYGDKLSANLVACGGDTSCIARIGGKIGADEILIIGVSRFGDVILTIQRVGVKSASVLARIAEALPQGAAIGDDAALRYVKRVLPKSDFLRYGTIRVRANVAGALVVIGDQQHGLTPIAPVRVIAPATYELTLSKKGYQPFEASVEVPPDAAVEVRPRLELARSDRWYTRWWVVAIAGAAMAGAITATTLVYLDKPTDVPVTIEPF